MHICNANPAYGASHVCIRTGRYFILGFCAVATQREMSFAVYTCRGRPHHCTPCSEHMCHGLYVNLYWYCVPAPGLNHRTPVRPPSCYKEASSWRMTGSLRCHSCVRRCAQRSMASMSPSRPAFSSASALRRIASAPALAHEPLIL